MADKGSIYEGGDDKSDDASTVKELMPTQGSAKDDT